MRMINVVAKHQEIGVDDRSFDLNFWQSQGEESIFGLQREW